LPVTAAVMRPIEPPSLPSLLVGKKSTMTGAQETALYIRQLIFDGVLRRRTRIPQDAIAVAIRRSRALVREALVDLEREGWVRVITHRGAHVAPFTPESLRDHYELLGLTYGLAARRAVERDDRELAHRLTRISKGLRDVQDVGACYESALSFHAAIVDTADSPTIRSVLRSMTAIVPGNFFNQVPGSSAVERRSTTAIRHAIGRRDGDAAAIEYGNMLRRHGAMVSDLLTARGLFADSEKG
jgi:DNA-binding GntR family transcriptional regulator